MKRLILIGLGLVCLAMPAVSRAQSGSVDASIGYSYFRLGNNGGINQNGVSGSVAYNFNHYFGVAADIGGYHASPGGASLNTWTYMFGPRITAHNFSRVSPFIQFLVGGSHITGGFNQLAYSIGGGVDIGMLPHLALRPQLDYVGLDTSGGNTNCTRVSVSLVAHF
jgi:Outer membrane protein beta-barrel domain